MTKIPQEKGLNYDFEKPFELPLKTKRFFMIVQNEDLFWAHDGNSNCLEWKCK